MGQSQLPIKQKEDYQLVQQLTIGNIVKHTKTQSLHFLKCYSFTAQQEYQNALNMHSLKLANKNQHILNFMHFTTKAENSFCSSFYKIMLVYQYVDYSLEKEIMNRVRNSNPFNQKQIWSILCSCVLAAVHLVHTQGKMHCGLTAKDIRLTKNGCVKLLSHEMVGIDLHHTQSQGVPKTLAITLIQCLQMKKISNQQLKYLQKIILDIECSKQMKQILELMLKNNITFLVLQEYLFKLVQDDQSLPSYNNTPILKAESPLTLSDYKCARNLRNQNKIKQCISIQSKSQIIVGDVQDMKSYLFMVEECGLEVQNPDETAQETNNQTNHQYSSPQHYNQFYPKQHQFQSNPKKQHLKLQQFNKLQKIQKKQYQINPAQSTRRKQSDPQSKQNTNKINKINKINTNNQVLILSSQNQSNLFTDPKLFSLIKTDLEQIKMRRSNGQLAINKTIQLPNKYNSIEQPTFNKLPQFQTLNNYQTNQQNSKQITKIEYENSIQVNNWFKDNKYKDTNFKIQTNKYYNVKATQMMHEEQKITSYRNIMDKVKVDSVLQVQKNQNIMNDTAIGFKKKKQETAKFEMSKQKQNLQSPALVAPKYSGNKYQQNIAPSKLQQKFSPKSKTVGMKPVEAQKNMNLIKQQEFFNQYANSHTSQPFSSSESSRTSFNRIQKAQRDMDKLIHVSQKLTRGHYQGTKINGKRHGFGTFIYSEGGKYVGNWRQNKMHGKGILYYPNQKVAYDGEWQNDQLSGYGILYNEEVSPLRNPFDYRDWTDAEDYWVKYQGHFYQDNKQGQGILYLANGQRLQAEFHDDKVDGEGILFRGDGNSVRGRWRQNKLIKMF